VARAAPRVVNNLTAPPHLGVSPFSRRNSVAAEPSFAAQTGNPRFIASFAKRYEVRERVSAEFCAKQGSEFCTPMAKNRIRDNASLSAPNDAGADHDRRGSRVRRLAKELTILTVTGRASSRLCTSRRESVFCEAHAGRSSRAREPRGSAACRETAKARSEFRGVADAG